MHAKPFITATRSVTTGPCHTAPVNASHPSAAGTALIVVALLALTAGAASANEWQEKFADRWPHTDFSRTTVEVSEIHSGGPPKDGIPAIDEPRFVAVDEAADWLHPREPVIALEIDGEARAYPLQILIWHEIVNDRLAATPVAVTFCPLCNAAIVFDRRLAGRVLDFGTTGKLRLSDLVMYDRQTESWWQQFSGTAIAGDYAGRELRRIAAPIVAFEDFRDAHPDGDVLSRRTGHRRNYGRNPYRGYDRVGDQPFLLRKPADPRLPAMERVLGVEVGDEAKVFPLSRLAAAVPLVDEVGGTPIAVFAKAGTLSALDAGEIRASRQVPAAAAYDRRLGGRTLSFERRGDTVVDRETGSRWNILGHAIAGPLEGQRLSQVDGGVHFAFAWLVFNPDSVVVETPLRLK